MKTQNFSQKKAILGLALVAGFVFFYAVSQYDSKKTQSVFSEFSPINYIMGKIKGQDAGFSLEGREIDNQFLAQAKKVKKTKKAQSVKADNKKALTPPQNAKTQAAQAVNVRKQQAAKRQAVQQARKKALKTTPPPALKKSMEAQNTAAKNEKVAQKTTEDSAVGAAPSEMTDATALLDGNNNQEPAKKTLEQWKGELYAEQSKEFIVKLAAALKSGDISEENYHLLVKELIESNDEKFVALGLYALRSAPSIKSFSQLAEMETVIQETALKAYVKDSLLSYNQVGLRGILQNAIIQKDKTVALKALEVTNQGLSYIQSGDYSVFNGPRNIRDTSSQTVSVGDYKSFLPYLNQAITSGDAEIVAMATKIINLINQSTMIASN